MKKAIIIPKGGDLISFAAQELLSAGENMPRSLVLFPGRRPAHFLRRALAQELKRPFQSPQVHSIDDWVDGMYRGLEAERTPMREIDAVGVLYDIHNGVPGSSSGALALEEFIPWGHRLLSAFEELYIEHIQPEALAGLEVLAEEKLPLRIRKAFSGLAGLYEAFYKRIEGSSYSSRSFRYRKLSECCENMDLSLHPSILLIGFYALTASEKAIFKKLLAHEGSLFILQDGPGITGILQALEVEPDHAGNASPTPTITYHKTPDVHGEVMKLNQIITRKPGQHSQAVVLPSSRALFPIIQNTLPIFGEDWNISMGFPLQATPIYSMMAVLSRVLESRIDGLYFVPDYLRLMLHPYIKNLYLDGASYPTRILCHTIEEVLTARGSRFLKLSDIEEDDYIMRLTMNRFRGAGISDGEENIVRHINSIHKILLESFESVKSIRDFCDRVLDLVSNISLNSPANRHPFTARFIESLIETVADLRLSSIADYALSDILSYFTLLDGYTSRLRIPLPGTPLKGFQVLGLLETRNLGFKRLYILDANEGEIPTSHKQDPFLPFSVRKELALPTYHETDQMESYYFENLIAAADEVHIFYKESEESEKSRFVERLIWNEEKRAGVLGSPKHEVILFKAKFSQSPPAPIKKTERMLQFLRAQPFSPSGLDRYLRCPLSFFYRYGLSLREKGELAEQLEPLEIGNLVHRILRNFFVRKVNKRLKIRKSDFDLVLKLADQAFEEEYGDSHDGRIHMVKSQIKTRLPAILKYHEKSLKGAVILECEEMHTSELEIPESNRVTIRGKIDRIDKRNGQIVILDYKTGASFSKPRSDFSLKTREEWHKTLASVQLPFYMMLYKSEHPELDADNMNSCFMSLGSRPMKEDFLLKDPNERSSLYLKYEKAIQRLIAEILDPNIDFLDSPTPDKSCPSCRYRVICGRQWMVRHW